MIGASKVLSQLRVSDMTVLQSYVEVTNVPNSCSEYDIEYNTNYKHEVNYKIVCHVLMQIF